MHLSMRFKLLSLLTVASLSMLPSLRAQSIPSQIAALQRQITKLQGQVTTLQGQVSALQSDNSALWRVAIPTQPGRAINKFVSDK
jgi:peptidoglycan hydrolase CwlO-like protein